MVGRKVEQPLSRAAAGHRRRAARGARTAAAARVRGVSLEVRAGEVVGLGGLVGSGRSELLRLIYGIDPPEEGEVLVDGEQLPPNRPDRAIAAGLGLAPEDRKSQGLLLDWSLTKNVSLADLGRFSRGLLDVSAERGRGARAAARPQTVPDDPERIARELSGGNQQKVVLARWLLRECRVLLLDEPTRGRRRGHEGRALPGDLRPGRRPGSACWSSRPSSRSWSASAPGSSSCARASWWPRSTGGDANERELLATRSRPPTRPDFVEEVG